MGDEIDASVLALSPCMQSPGTSCGEPAVLCVYTYGLPLLRAVPAVQNSIKEMLESMEQVRQLPQECCRSLLVIPKFIPRGSLGLYAD